MSVFINLKEVFSSDSQNELTSKLNFNFNQLLSLGVGQVGPKGDTGATGPAGPVGPTGTQGEAGSYIFSQSTSGGSPTGIIPSGIRDGDILISTDTIWQRNTSGTSGWTEVSNFNDLVQLALTSNVSPYKELEPSSRIIKPRITAGLDLTNSGTISAPNYAKAGLGTNYQTVLYNFDESKTWSIKNSGGTITIAANGTVEKTFDTDSIASSTIEFLTAHGFSDGDYVVYSSITGTPIGGLSNLAGYYTIATGLGPQYLKLAETYADAIALNAITFTSVPSSETHSLTTALPDPEKVFPQTANLTVYSFFDAGATESREFANTLKGYRHQIELGSVDVLPTEYGTSGTSYDYVVSPSFENLRIKKYRITGDLAWNADNPGKYYLRAEYNLSSNGYDDTNPEDFSPRRNSEHVWLINKAETDPDDSRVFEMRFTNGNITQVSDPTLNVEVDGVVFKRNTANNDLNTSMFGIGYKPSGTNIIGVNASSDIDAFDFYNMKVNISNATTWIEMYLDVSNDLAIEHTDNTKQIRLNNAVKVKGDRLNAGLPFASTSFASVDANTLDHYAEGVLGSDSTHAGRLVIIKNGAPVDVATNAPGLITYSRYYYTRIGRQVTVSFTAILDLNSWPADGGGNTYRGIGVSLPYSLGVEHGRLNINVYDDSTLPYIIIPETIPLADEETYSNFVGFANGVYGQSVAYFYLYSPHTLPADTGSSPANQLNRYILFNRDTRNPKDLGAFSGAKWADSCVVTGSGTYFTTT